MTVFNSSATWAATFLFWGVDNYITCMLDTIAGVGTTYVNPTLSKINNNNNDCWAYSIPSFFFFVLSSPSSTSQSICNKRSAQPHHSRQLSAVNQGHATLRACVASLAAGLPPAFALLGGGRHRFRDWLRLSLLQRPRLQSVPSHVHYLGHVQDCQVHSTHANLKALNSVTLGCTVETLLVVLGFGFFLCLSDWISLITRQMVEDEINVPIALISVLLGTMITQTILMTM